jgi:hypothetical protein
MKKNILFFAIALLIGVFAYSQNQVADLKGINYQAVAIDDETHQIVGADVVNKPLYQREIGVRFTITDGPSGSSVYYQDEHVTTTDKYGLFSLVIGLGAYTSGAYTRLLDIPWINGDQWLMVEITFKNDGNYKQVSYEKFMSVPFAYYTDDIADNSITTWKIVDETIQDEDIDTSAVTTSEILDETILAEDIATSAVTTSEILDETILAEDIATGAVTTSEILDETILAEDIATGAVTTSEILDETILAEDIATGAVTTSEISDGTILNEDIQNGTIDLTTKVTGILPVQNGGTGLDGSTAANGTILIGNGTGFTLDSLTAGAGITITNSSGGIVISSSIAGVNSVIAPNVSPGSIANGTTWVSGPLTLNGIVLGNIIVGSINGNLQGCMMTCYVSGNNQIRVAIFNGTGGPANFNSNGGIYTLKVLVVQ